MKKPTTGLVLALAFFICGSRAQAPSSNSSPDLSGTSWQLVRFLGNDNKNVAPEEKSHYTVAFSKDGTIVARVDCNRGHGTWKSDGPNQLELGPLALTRAMCPPVPLNNRIPADWENVRTYSVKGGHLFLSLMANAGVYEFEPSPEEHAPIDSGTAQTSTRLLSMPPVTFTGILPCADCPGIHFQLNLQPDRTYSSRMIYEGSNISFDNRGTWQLNDEGKTLWLRDAQGSTEQFAVHDDGILRQLDANGHESHLSYDLNRTPFFMPMEFAPLEKTEWKLIWLSDSNPGSEQQHQQAYLVLDPATHRVSGSGGCNRLIGSYQITGDQIRFIQMAGTMMACIQGMDAEKAFLHALGQASSWKISGQNLEFFDSAGNDVARFERRGSE